MLLAAEHLEKNYGMKRLIQDASLYLDTGDKVGIIGVNGTGKSTLLRVLARAEEPDSGTVHVFPDVQVSYLPQNPDMDPDATVLEQVFRDLPDTYRAVAEYEARTMLTRLGVPDSGQKIGTLSGGQRKRVALATALIHPADLLILDEPTNHLDMDMAAWLEDYLIRFSGGILLITHDRYFLDRVTNRIVELENGRLYSYVGGYADYLVHKAERLEAEQAGERKRQATLRRGSCAARAPAAPRAVTASSGTRPCATRKRRPRASGCRSAPCPGGLGARPSSLRTSASRTGTRRSSATFPIP